MEKVRQVGKEAKEVEKKLKGELELQVKKHKEELEALERQQELKVR